MITAHLVGDDAVLAWLRATPDLAASGLARAITSLGGFYLHAIPAKSQITG